MRRNIKADSIYERFLGASDMAMDIVLLKECIADLNNQIQEWLGVDIPSEGSEDYAFWQMKISLVEQIESISDVYQVCDGGDFTLPAILERK